mmetsp:Transcript_21875/g.48028  ORF Transcript_21875/g.48028 Transcript_21875/m.48028 type:complete len:267 (-) Transcript_21875:47-847(-)
MGREMVGPRTLVACLTFVVFSTLLYALLSLHYVRRDRNHGVSASDLAMSGQAKNSDLSGADLEFPTGQTGRFVLLDTEYTTWEGAHARHWSGPGEARELVQIAAIKVDNEEGTGGYREVASWSTLVTPKKNPKLSDYFIKLTEITQEKVDRKGMEFTGAMSKLRAFTEGGTLPIWHYGKNDKEVIEETARVQQVDISLNTTFSGGFNNIRPIFGRCGLMPWKWTSGSIHRAVGVDMSGHVHNALFDVRSILATLDVLRRRPNNKCI